MIKVKEYQGLRLRHEVNLDMYSGESAFALLDEKESYAKEDAERWNEGADYRLLVTRKPKHLIIRFLKRVPNVFFSNGLACHSQYCDRWQTQRLDYYKIIS